MVTRTESTAESDNDVLESVHRRFIDETYGVNGLFFESILKTQEQLATLVIADNSEELFAKSKILREGINDWLESLVKLTHSYAARLTALIMADSRICKTENPAQWIRLWLEDHLQKYLRQELNSEKLADMIWQRRIAKTAPIAESQEQSVQNRKHRCSRVESWLRRVADNDWHPDRWRDQPDWLAPVWCEEQSSVRLMLKKRGTCPARLTEHQTARLVRSEEHNFAARLEYVLGVEEDEARITLAQQPQVAQGDLAKLIVPPSVGGMTDRARGEHRKKRTPGRYRSTIKRHIKNCLTNNPAASALEICGYLDEQDVDNIPSSWLKNNNRELTVAYRNEKVRSRIDAMISKVRADLRAE